MTLTFGSLFAGIGGFDLGLERAGMVCKWQVEIDPFCRKVLEKHWPGVPKYGDIREINGSELEPVDLICGGFPCQDISFAGLGAGLEGERSGLWSHYIRIVRNIRPQFVLVENVSALLVRGLERVLIDLAAAGYDAEWDCLPASYFSAPHIRERVYILAYSYEVYGRSRLGNLEDGKKPIFAGSDCESYGIWLQAASEVDRMDDGLPREFYKDRVGSLGNAVVPQVAEWIGRRIMESLCK